MEILNRKARHDYFIEEEYECGLVLTGTEIKSIRNGSYASFVNIEDETYFLIVGSISGKTGGFYICQTEEEIQDTIENIKNRAKQMFYMCGVLERKKKGMLK